MKFLPWIVLAIVALMGGGALYAQGAGYFWPCEPAGNAGYCEEVFSSDGRSFQAMALRPDGLLSLVSREAGIDPKSPLSLMTVQPQSGTITDERPLSDLPSAASPSRMVIDDSGAHMAIAGLDFFVVTDLAGAVIRDIARGLPDYMGFDAQGRLLVFQESRPQPIPGKDQVLAFDLSAPSPAQTGVADVGTLFSRGLNRAISPNGLLVAQRIATPERNGLVAIRLATRERADEAGLLLSPALDEGCGYLFVDLAFSPDGRYVAATFDCPFRWGREGSALVIWNLETGLMAHRIPTRHDWGAILWIDDATLMATRYDVDTRRAGLFRITPQH